MIVIKKINNNVAICKDNNNHELVAFGKGIGFPSVPYQITDLKKIDRTFYNISPQYLSLINAQLGSKAEELPELEQSSEEIIEQTTLIIELELGLHVQRDTFNYARFATHIQYLLKRVFQESYIDSDNFLMYQSICDEYQEIADCVDKICIYYQNVWSIQLSEEEKLYLILHVNRVCSREDN